MGNENNPPLRVDDRPTKSVTREGSSNPKSKIPELAVTSPSVDGKGFISIDCTCDRASQSPAVAWRDATKGIKSLVLSLWNTAPNQVKSSWLIDNIPANLTKLERNAKTVGNLGLNDKRRAEYDPICSKGPVVKDDHITLFALSAEPQLSPDKNYRAAL